ncbi:hypothetical protein ABPG72_016532 [Tetrahymena utriculariae]
MANLTNIKELQCIYIWSYTLQNSDTYNSNNQILQKRLQKNSQKSEKKVNSLNIKQRYGVQNSAFQTFLNIQYQKQTNQEKITKSLTRTDMIGENSAEESQQNFTFQADSLNLNTLPNRNEQAQNEENTLRVSSNSFIYNQRGIQPNESSSKQQASMSIKEFSSIAPNVKALRELCSYQGFYTPRDASMKWLLRKYIERKLPSLQKIKKCPEYCKLTKDQCIEIINQLCPELECKKRFELDWLKDVAYTLSAGNHQSFNQIGIKRSSTRKQEGESSIELQLPQQLPQEIVSYMKSKYKPERLATTRYLNSLRDKLQTNLANCIICLDNSYQLSYTTCCKQPLHQQCKAQLIRQICPLCKSSDRFSLQNIISDYSRAYNVIN